MTSHEDLPSEQDAVLNMHLRQAAEHHQAGRLDEAEQLYQALLRSQPAQADANHNMGVLMVQRGQPSLALPFFKSALTASPERAHHWLGYIETLAQAGQPEAACRILELGRKNGLQGSAVDALALRLSADPAKEGAADLPRRTHGADESGVKVSTHGSEVGAASSCKPALMHSGEPLPGSASGSPAAHEIELILTLYGQGHLDRVEQLALSLVDRFPRDSFGWKVLGGVAVHQRRLEEALVYMERCAELAPHDIETHSNLAYIFRDLGRKLEAEASFRRALALRSDDAATFNDLGVTLLDQGRLSEAETCFRQASAIKPGYEDAFGNLLFTLNYDSDKSCGEIFAAYMEYELRFGAPLRHEWRKHTNSRNTTRRLKVGYVSPDFRNHAVRYFLEPVLANHDKSSVEIIAYAELSQEDAVTVRYRHHVDHWVPTAGLSDSALADRIRADGVDILVDLAGHTARNRLGVFARKPAPVSVTWLGYGYTTGLDAVDYMLTDRICAPVGSEEFFSEQPWRLDNAAYVYSPAEDCGNISALPAAKRGYVTFGTLTRAVRINHRTIRVWSEVLRNVAGSRLVINSDNFREPAMQAGLAARFAAHGISPDRLDIGYRSPPWEVLHGMDITLDCFPHNSGTTLFESLYMGIPYITLAGRPSVGLLGSSILEGVGHSEWIARTEDEYVEKAVMLASDLPRLAELRAALRNEMRASTLMDAPAFARKIEAAFRDMFQLWSDKS